MFIEVFYRKQEIKILLNILEQNRKIQINWSLSFERKINTGNMGSDEIIYKNVDA